MTAAKDSHVWMVGAGIDTMAAAVFLIRDAGVPGKNIHFLEQLDVEGGSLDGARSPIPKQQHHAAYVTRGGRMLEEEAYQCLWNLLGTIPPLRDGLDEMDLTQPSSPATRPCSKTAAAL